MPVDPHGPMEVRGCSGMGFGEHKRNIKKVKKRKRVEIVSDRK
jgi:hypothetical protein